MINFRVRIKSNAAALARAAERGNDTALRRAGAYVRGMTMRGIRTSSMPADPGRFPHTRKGRLRKAIVFAVEERGVNVIIGPSAGAVGQIGATHEFGGIEKRKGTTSQIDSAGRPIRVPGANWILALAGHGPIDVLAPGEFRYAKLWTMRQVRRAQEITEGDDKAFLAIKALRVRRKYPKRPFMRPTLDRALGERKLPKFWHSTIRA